MKNYLLTGVSFKTRYNQHKPSLKPNKSTQTTLSTYIKKSKLTIYKTTCKPPYKPKACNICNLERIAIAEFNREISLNQRTELSAPTSDCAVLV